MPINTYEFVLEATCPVDPRTKDHYAVTIEAPYTIVVEDLLAIRFGAPCFQEDITAHLAKKFKDSTVKTIGTHSGVRTVCVAP